MSTNWSDGVSVIVPTYMRPDGIKTALNSLKEQSNYACVIEIIVADNDPAGSAKPFVIDFAKSCNIPVIYKHVPEPGVSNARNGAVAIARGRFIAFLDDDMEALPGWVDELVKTALKYKAAICFGPAIAAMPKPDDPLNAFMQPFFSRTTDSPEGIIKKTFGTGGCLIDRGICELPQPPFDTKFNETGGEDDALFQYLIGRGASIGWAAKAKSWEHVPAKRANRDYIWKRNFAFGQGPTQEAYDAGWRGLPGIIKWMGVGAVQLVLYGLPMAALKLLGKPKYIHYYARTAQALGKMFWWRGFKPKLYGANATTEHATP